MRNRTRLLLALLAVSAPVISMTSCSHKNPDIPLVNQNPYWSKAYFNPEESWYYRSTVADTAPNYAGPVGPFGPSTSVGDGDWLMLERVKFEVTENQLIAWSERASTPGSEYDALEGASDVYRGAPVAIFAIADHFDIRRNFDPTTGEQGNVITENRDRPWYQREFIRVDWSKNLVPTYKWHVWLEQSGDSFAVANDDPANPKRFRFETDNGKSVADGGKPTYFEVTTRTTVEPDLASIYGFYGAGYTWDTAASILDVRHSFMKVPESDYVPLPMPPSVVMVDDEGQEVRDEQGFAVRVPINDRFGFFGALGRNTFDENRGIVTSGQIWNASRFSIWKKSRNADGSVIPVEQREPKPIVYYTNVEYPRALLNGGRRVEADWNRAFQEVVFYAQPQKYTSIDDVPAMWILKENDCNPTNVESVLAGLDGESRELIETKAKTTDGRFDGTFQSVKARVEHANDPDNTEVNFTVRQTEETQALNDLERICAALEYYTNGDITVGRAPIGDTPFKYQRLGDTRHSMMNLIMQDHQGGWLGLGPPYADPFSGETISATSNIAVNHLDYSAARVAKVVEILNGEVDANDLTSGQDIQRYMRKKLADNKILVGKAGSSDELKQSMDQRLAALLARPDALREISPNRAQSRKEKLHGSAVEQMMLTNDDLMMFGGMDPSTAQGGDAQVTEELLNRASPLRNGLSLESAREREQRVMRMGMRAMDSPEYLDNMIVGRALAMRDLPYAERFKKLREEIFVAVMLHEVGHNMGLMHNFAASSDALNYGPRFWDVQKLPTDIDDAIGAVSNDDDLATLENCRDELDAVRDASGQTDFVLTTQDCLNQSEAMYSSIMDYHATFNADFNGLGPYDKQAVKFAYGNLIEVFNEDAYAGSFDPGQTDLKRWSFLNDWRDLAGSVLKDTDSIQDRDYVKFEWNRASTKSAVPERAVPYKFCYGYPPEPGCHTYDIGPDTQTNAVNVLNEYWQRYFFSHFARDRLWDWNDPYLPLFADARAIDDFTEKMQFYFYYKATDPEFTGSYAEKDFLATTVTGLNFLGNIISHPGSGRHITMPKYSVFGLTNDSPDERIPGDGQSRIEEPSDILRPWDYFSDCMSLRATTDGDFNSPLPNYTTSNVDLGDGRPFFIGLTEDYEEWYVRYIGSYWAKSLVIESLGYNYAWFPRFDDAVDYRLVDVSWYRLFPKEVAKIFNDLITDQYVDLGPVLDDSGNVEFRNLIDPVTGDTPDYTGKKRIMPSISYNHEYSAAVYANVYMKSTTDDQADLTKSMKIAMLGGDDDIGAFDQAIADDIATGCPDPAVDQAGYDACPDAHVASFTHPVSGLTMRALKAGDQPIAWNLMKRVHVIAERYNRLQACQETVEDADPNTNPTDEYCGCIEAVDYRSADDLTLVCKETKLSMPGTGICAYYDLKNRRDSAREQMDDMFDYMGDIRFLNRIFENPF